MIRRALVLAVLLVVSGNPAAEAAGLPDTVRAIKPSIVGVGTYQKIRRPPSQLRGTGFVVVDGTYVVTNNHVIPERMEDDRGEYLAVFAGRGSDARVIKATVFAKDEHKDVAVLKIAGRLPAMKFGDDTSVEEGQRIAFTGFPIGAVLGLYPATHRGIVSALTPLAIPQRRTRRLDPEMIRRLRQPIEVFQLDATAYPGNSGSPLFDPETGAVYGIISSVYVKESKENVLRDPSGVTYAVPIRHVVALLRAKGVIK